MTTWDGVFAAMGRLALALIALLLSRGDGAPDLRATGDWVCSARG